MAWCVHFYIKVRSVCEMGGRETNEGEDSHSSVNFNHEHNSRILVVQNVLYFTKVGIQRRASVYVVDTRLRYSSFLETLA